MTVNRDRPDGLPDFERPPLSEVVVGVQYAPIQKFGRIDAYQVWELYRQYYQHVAEQPSLPPSFETFGRSEGDSLQLRISNEIPEVRYWFISEEGNDLLQFQNDRLLHNWRKLESDISEYPRFEPMIELFEKELSQLSDFYGSEFDQSLSVNQCEISYVNTISLDGSGQKSKPAFWISFISDEALAQEEIMASFRHVLRDQNENPHGRLIVDLKTGIKNKEKVLTLNLTVRGKPAGNGLDQSIDYLRKGRMLIVESFKQLTTADAHLEWGIIE